ncbi:MAG: zf-TFIIB domain-containing protein [Acidobacteria bacterium]|nr:zf-TFIIB domain-containing protein [Acidobacteriota bacterium]
MTDSDQIRKGLYNCPNCGAAGAPAAQLCSYCGSSLASDVCPACFGAVFHGMKHCPSCGAEFTKADRKSPSSLRCPRCNKPFEARTLGKHRLQQCPGCGGLWVDLHAVERICADHEDREAVLAMPAAKNSAPAESPRLPKGRVYVPCPVCRKLMNRRSFTGGSGVVVDSCKQHGIWFDRGELARIISFIRSGGMKKAREWEKAKIEDARQQLRDEQLRMAAMARRFGDDAAAGADLDLDGPSLLGIIRSLKCSL